MAAARCHAARERLQALECPNDEQLEAFALGDLGEAA